MYMCMWFTLCLFYVILLLLLVVCVFCFSYKMCPLVQLYQNYCYFQTKLQKAKDEIRSVERLLRKEKGKTAVY